MWLNYREDEMGIQAWKTAGGGQLVVVRVVKLPRQGRTGIKLGKLAEEGETYDASG